MILMRTFNSSLPFVSNCLPARPQPALRRHSKAVLHRSFGDSCDWCHLKPPCYPDQERLDLAQEPPDWVRSTSPA